MLTQRQWRIGAAAAVVCAAVMAWCGLRWPGLRQSLPLYCLYWGVFAILLLGAVYTALLDMRYIRARYIASERRMFKETFEDEAFRAAVREAKAKYAEEKRRTEGSPPINRQN